VIDEVPVLTGVMNEKVPVLKEESEELHGKLLDLH
jgi:hypothetical protein